VNRLSGARVVVDTSVISLELAEQETERLRLYAPFLTGRRLLVSFQTACELQYGALRGRWGERRLRRLAWLLEVKTKVMQSDGETIVAAARLRSECDRLGHALAAKDHEGDRWVAATAIRPGVPLVAHDGIFLNAPGLQLLTLLDES
jgi:predicted nucleic acid-binding protein